MTRIAIGDVSCPNCENVELSLSEYWVKLSLFELSGPPWVSSGTTKKLQQHHLQQQLCFIHFYLLVRILRNLGFCNGHNFGHALQNIFLRMTEIERKVSFCLKSEVNTHRFSMYLLLKVICSFSKRFEGCLAPDLSFVQRLFLAVVVPWNRMSSNIWT